MLTVLWHQLPMSFLRNMAAGNPEMQTFQRLRRARDLCLHCVNCIRNSHGGGGAHLRLMSPMSSDEEELLLKYIVEHLT